MELNELIHLWEVSSLNSESKNLIEYELRNRIDTNNNFSREYFFSG